MRSRDIILRQSTQRLVDLALIHLGNELQIQSLLYKPQISHSSVPFKVVVFIAGSAIIDQHQQFLAIYAGTTPSHLYCIILPFLPSHLY